jgi:Kef-type K+ transport system membrane component KefB
MDGAVKKIEPRHLKTPIELNSQADSMRKIGFFIGLFALMVGLLTYDPEITTAPVPVITGILVMLLAIFNLIPEFVPCVQCGKKILKSASTCRFCSTKQDTRG